MSKLIDKMINLIDWIIDKIVGGMVAYVSIIVLITLILVGSFLIVEVCVQYSRKGALCSLSSNILNYFRGILS
jgi:hypothetical protein